MIMFHLDGEKKKYPHKQMKISSAHPPNENSTQTNLSPTVNSDETQTFDVKNEKDITHISETLFSGNYVYYTMY